MNRQSISTRVESVVLAALECDASDRRAYVSQACGDDAQLLEMVSTLLGNGDSISTAMLRDKAGLTLLTTASEILPIRLERYSLESRIGEGAFGVVYRAVQHTPVKRTVAIKVLRPGLDSAEVVRRFEAERQALATMDHVNIARLFDAGNMPDGRPYFVMELLEGEPLNDYCDRRKLDIRGRLALFLEACAGVEHAHRRGILHRDLKPSNMLVADGEGTPVVKVIDFGIARALGSEIPFGTLATEAGRLMGTPEYMSPEQIDGDAGDVDTRSDVYALGVVLYELLCGRLPFDAKRLRSSRLSELRRIICDDQPALPSRTHSGGEAGLAQSAANRGTTAAELTQSLKREIEWVPMRALRKATGERYRGAAELADDVRNYLSGKPLLAGPDSAAYRTRKFVSRHRSTVAATIAILFLLVAAIVGTSIGMVKARRQSTISQVQLAESLVVRGQYAVDQFNFVDAWEAFEQARQIQLHLGKPTLPSELGLYTVLAKADPPAAILQTSMEGTPWLRFIDDGRTLITSSTGGTTIEWDVKSRRRLRELPWEVVAVSRDGQTWYTLDKSKRLEARDRRAVAPTITFALDVNEVIERCTVSPDGRWLVACHSGFTVAIWDAATGKRRPDLPVTRGIVRKVEFTPDGSRAIMYSSDDTFAVYDPADWKNPAPLKVETIEAQDIDLSASGRVMAIGDRSGKLKLVDPSSGALIQSFDVGGSEVNRVCISPDEKWMVSAGAEASVQLWDLTPARHHRRMFGHRRPVRAVAFSPDGRQCATASVDGEVRLWDLDAPRVEFEVVRENPGEVYEFPFSADDRRFIRESDDNDRHAEVWDVEQRKLVCRLETPVIPMWPRFTADCKRILAADRNVVCEWDATTGRKIRALVTHGDMDFRGFFSSPDGSQIHTFGDEIGLQSWDVATRSLRWERRTPSREWHFYAFSDDGSRIAKLSDDGSIEIIRGDTGATVTKFNTVPTPTGFADLLFIKGRPDELLWWHLNDGRPRLKNYVTGWQAWIVGEQLRQRALNNAITSDGKMLGIGNGARRIDFVDIADGHPLFTAMLPRAAKRWGFSPRMTRLVLEETDNRIWIADLTMGPRLVESHQLRPTDGITPAPTGSKAGSAAGAKH